MKQSAKFTLNKTDVVSQAKSALIFLGPSLLAFLVALSPAVNSITTDNTQKMFLVIAVKWGLDQLTGLLRKFLAGR